MFSWFVGKQLHMRGNPNLVFRCKFNKNRCDDKRFLVFLRKYIADSLWMWLLWAIFVVKTAI